MYSARHVRPVGFSPVVERPPLLLTPQTHSVTRGRGAGYAPCSVCNAPTGSLCFCIMVALVLHKCLFQVVLGWYWGHVDVCVNEMLSTPRSVRVHAPPLATLSTHPAAVKRAHSIVRHVIKNNQDKALAPTQVSGSCAEFYTIRPKLLKHPK